MYLNAVEGCSYHLTDSVMSTLFWYLRKFRSLLGLAIRRALIKSSMNWKLVLIFVVLSYLAVAQRGGGGGGGGSRSSSSRSRSSHHRNSMQIAHCKHECDISPTSSSSPAALTECYKVCDPPFSWGFFGFFLTAILAVFGCVTNAQNKKRQEIIDKFKAEHAEGLRMWQVNEDEIKTQFHQLISHDWYFLVFQTVNTYESDHFKMKHQTIGSEKYFKKVSIQGKDQVGTWKGEGYLSFGKNGTKFFMIKDYDDKKAAGQTGKWEYLIYKGEEINGQIDGDWEYLGFKGSSEYSGMFRLMQVKKD